MGIKWFYLYKVLIKCCLWLLYIQNQQEMDSTWPEEKSGHNTARKQPWNHTEYGVVVRKLTLEPDRPHVPLGLSFSIWKVGLTISIYLTGLWWRLQELMWEVCRVELSTWQALPKCSLLPIFSVAEEKWYSHIHRSSCRCFTPPHMLTITRNITPFWFSFPSTKVSVLSKISRLVFYSTGGGNTSVTQIGQESHLHPTSFP